MRAVLATAGFFAAADLTAGFFATGAFRVVLATAGFFAAADLATGFLATGALRAVLATAGFFAAADLATGFLATGAFRVVLATAGFFAAVDLVTGFLLADFFAVLLRLAGVFATSLAELFLAGALVAGEGLRLVVAPAFPADDFFPAAPVVFVEAVFLVTDFCCAFVFMEHASDILLKSVQPQQIACTTPVSLANVAKKKQLVVFSGLYPVIGS